MERGYPRLLFKARYTQKWLKKRRIRVNGTKSVQVTFTTRRETCSAVILNGLKIPQAEDAKYLGLPRSQTEFEKAHIHQRKQLGIQLNKMYWLLGSKSQLSIENRLLLYKAILKSI